VNKADELNQLKKGQFITGSTDLAACLIACGCSPLSGSPCTNTYTEARPFKSGQPGEVLYHLEKQSSTFTGKDGVAILTERLAAAFESKDANEILDQLIEEIEDVDLRNRIKEQLPLAIMSHHRAAMGNRSIIRKWWRKVEPWVYIKRGNKRFLLPRSAKKTAQRWGLK
tara:strand:+ start:63 stop:569 length:507 start_codon:yes stop_codon:yes gene_type:complete